jgi:hypothetical protein
MPQNPAYLDAEARIFRRFGLTPTVRPLAPTQPPLRLRVAEVGGGRHRLPSHRRRQGQGGADAARPL